LQEVRVALGLLEDDINRLVLDFDALSLERSRYRFPPGVAPERSDFGIVEESLGVRLCFSGMRDPRW
jgi:hypothetical protein